MNHLSKCLNRLEALDRHVTNLLGKPCEEGEEKKIHAIRRCGCLRYIKEACALFHVHGIQWTYIQKNMTEYVPLDVEQKLRVVMQCLSDIDTTRTTPGLEGWKIHLGIQSAKPVRRSRHDG